jgi:hypothetical protein
MVLNQDKAVVSRLAQGHRAMLNQKMSKDIATTRPKGEADSRVKDGPESG